MTDEACFERHSQAVEYFEQGVSRFRECLECELMGGFETMKYGYGTCRICGREVHLQSGGMCHFCEEQRKLAKAAGLTDEELIEKTIQGWTSTHTIYRGMRASKLIDWAAIASEKLKITHVEPPKDMKLTEPECPNKDDCGAYEPELEEYVTVTLNFEYPEDREILEQVTARARAQRRTVEQQILWELEGRAA